MKIVVFGGTGNYGKKIVKYLLLSGQSVRVVSRHAEKARQNLGPAVEVIEGDVLQAATISRALKDMDGIIICLSAVSWKLIRKMRRIEYDAVVRIIEEAESTGINRLVYLSVYNMRMDVLTQLGIPEFGRLKMDVENRIYESRMNWTILGCSPMYDLIFTFLRKGKMMVPGGGYRPFATVSDEDVGAVAAQAVVRNDLSGKRFRMTGPRAWSFPEAAAAISEITGQPVKHGKIPLFVINLVSLILWPVNPFFRYIYKSLILLNNFPEDESRNVPQAHRLLRETFDYQPRTLEREIVIRLLPYQKNPGHDV